MSFKHVLVTDFLQFSADYFSGKTAIIYGESRFSYQEINNAANRFANVLSVAGFKRGDRALILLENSVDLIIALFGILKAGGIFSVLNPGVKIERLKYIVENCQATTLISDNRHIGMIDQLTNNNLTSLENIWFCKSVDGLVPTIKHPYKSFDEDIAKAPTIPLQLSNIDLDLAALIYTSGSTGEPKGVMMTHRNIVSATTSINCYLANTSKDIILIVLPLSFDYGLYQIFLAFQVGATIVLERSFGYPYSVVGRMIKEGVTGLPGVPTFFALLFKLKLDSYNFPSLRYITNTGAPLPPSFSRKLRTMFPNVKVYSMYGLTECKRVSYLPPDELEKRPTSVGKSIPNVEVYLVDNQGNRLPPNQEGELVVRGSNVMQGYWGDLPGTNKVLRPGLYPNEKVLYTGDIFRIDDDGFLYFVSRKDDLFKSKGERISPKELEDVLYGLSGVDEVKVLGVPDEIFGNAIKAIIVVSDETLTEQKVIQYCRDRLEDFKVPHIIEFVSSLPKNANGKISLSADNLPNIGLDSES